MDAPNRAGDLLREWRGHRGLSQLDLSLAAGISSRHLSFLETGRSRPSRDMVLRLAEALGVPLRERNAMLEAAGFASVFRETDLHDEPMARARNALELILKNHEPYPAFVLDRAWTVVLANKPHWTILERFLPDASSRRVRNVMHLVLAPDLMRPFVQDWEAVAHVLGHRVQRQMRLETEAATRNELEAILANPGVKEAMALGAPRHETGLFLPLSLRLGDETLSWFSTIATFGTPRDVTLEELSIETLFPADEDTERLVRELVSQGVDRG